MGACPQARCCPPSLFLAWSSFWSADLKFPEGRAYGWAISEIDLGWEVQAVDSRAQPTPGGGSGERQSVGLPAWLLDGSPIPHPLQCCSQCLPLLFIASFFTYFSSMLL